MKSKHALTEYSQFESDRLMFKRDQNLSKQTKNIKKICSQELDKMEKEKNIHKRDFNTKENEKKVKDQASTIASDINKNMKKMNNLTNEIMVCNDTFYGIEEDDEQEEQDEADAYEH